MKGWVSEGGLLGGSRWVVVLHVVGVGEVGVGEVEAQGCEGKGEA